MNKLLSIIIPTYNMEEYLSKCLSSLLISDNLQLLEILIVNDGSKDKSLSIANEYYNRYPDIFKVIDKKNGNYGSCINAALSVASGCYVKVLDADDSFDTDSFNIYIKELCKVDVDLVITDYRQVNTHDEVIKNISYSIPSNQKLDYYSVSSKYEFANNIAMHAVTYKTQILKDIEYIQSEGISYTDEEWIFTPMAFVKNCYYFKLPIYNYLIGREGQTVNPEVAIRSINHKINGIYKMLDDYNSRNFASNSVRQYLDIRILNRIYGIYKSYLLEKNNLDLQDLFMFDLNILNLNKSLYHKVSTYTVHRYIPFKFISDWRRRKYIEKGIYSELYILLKNISSLFN